MTRFLIDFVNKTRISGCWLFFWSIWCGERIFFY